MIKTRSTNIQNYNQKGIYIMIICPLMSTAESFVECSQECALATSRRDSQECAIRMLAYSSKAASWDLRREKDDLEKKIAALRQQLDAKVRREMKL